MMIATQFKCSVLYLDAVIYTVPFAVLYLKQSASATHHSGMCRFGTFAQSARFRRKRTQIGQRSIQTENVDKLDESDRDSSFSSSR